jgi:hypothetical protein
MQAVSADACGAEWMLTRDLSGFVTSPVPVLSPADFLTRFPPPAVSS